MVLILFILIALAAAYAWISACALNVWQGVLAAVLMFLAVNVLFLLLLGVVSLFVNTKEPVKRQSRLCMFCCTVFAMWACEVLNIRIHVSGEELLPKNERFLYVSNHRTAFDPLSAAAALRKYNIAFISKPENLKLPILGALAHGAAYLGIDRENNREAMKTVIRASEEIKNGWCSIGIYPEGTRSRTGELLPFHAGSYKIAQMANVPVAVVCTRGTDTVMKNFPWEKTDVCLDVLEVIPAEKVCEMKTRELAEHSRNLIKGALEK